MDPYQRLAAGILKQATDDIYTLTRSIEICEQSIERLTTKGNKKRLKAEQDRLAALKSEYDDLLRFIKGDWCEALCELAKLDYEAVRDTMLNRGHKFDQRKTIPNEVFEQRN